MSLRGLPAGAVVAALRNRFPLMLGVTLTIMLAPLAWLPDLRESYAPYLTLATIATLALYAGTWALGRTGGKPSHALIIGVALALRLAMLPMPPSLSDDVFRYLWDGRLVLNGISPFVQVPADTSLARFHDELFERQGYPTTNTIYPPAAQIVFAASMAFADLAHDYRVGLFVWKLVLVGVEMLSIALLLRTLALTGRPARLALLYAWHPLAVIELAGQGHTDAFWVLAMALGLYWYASEARGGGLPGIILGAVTRLHPASLAPLWCRYAGRRQALAGLALSLPFLLLLLPLADPEAFASYTTVLARFTNFYEFNGGFYNGVKWLLDDAHIAPSNRIAGTIGVALQAVVALCVWLWPIRDRSVRSLATRALVLVTAQIALGAKVHAWYFAAPLFLVPLASRGALVWPWLWAALAVPFTYLMYATVPPVERMDVVIVEWGVFALLAIAGMVWQRFQPAAGPPVERSAG